MPIYIFVIFLVLMFLGMVAAWIPWRSIFEKKFQNNPTLGLLYIEFGEDTDCVECQYFYSNTTAAIYRYKWRGTRLEVLVNNDYEWHFLHGRRMIRLAHPGDAWASPWGQHAVPARYQKSAYDLNAVIEGNVGVELVRSIFKKQAISMMMVLLIIGGLVLGWFFVKPIIMPEPAGVTPPVQEVPVIPDNPDNVPHAGYMVIDYV